MFTNHIKNIKIQEAINNLIELPTLLILLSMIMFFYPEFFMKISQKVKNKVGMSDYSLSSINYLISGTLAAPFIFKTVNAIREIY